MLTVRKNDRVKILWGKDRGKAGDVIALDTKSRKVCVSKINIAKRHTRPQGQGQTGGIVDKELFLPIAKVMLVCPECKKATRPKYDKLTDGTSIRVCRKCEQIIPEPKKK